MVLILTHRPVRAAAIVCVVLAAAALGGSGLLLEAVEPEPAPVTLELRKPLPEEVVADLLKQLDTGSAKVRAAARARLRDMGPTILTILPGLHYGKTTAVRRQVLDVMDEVRREHRIPIDDDFLEFAVVTDPVWLIPAPGKTQPVKLELTILGRGKEARRFCLFDTIQITFYDSENQALKGVWGRNQLNGRDPWTPALGRGDLFVGRIFGTVLSRDPMTDELSLDGTEGFGGTFRIYGLKPGNHRVSIGVRNDLKLRSVRFEDGILSWNGSAHFVTNPFFVR